MIFFEIPSSRIQYENKFKWNKNSMEKNEQRRIEWGTESVLAKCKVLHISFSILFYMLWNVVILSILQTKGTPLHHVKKETNEDRFRDIFTRSIHLCAPFEFSFSFWNLTYACVIIIMPSYLSLLFNNGIVLVFLLFKCNRKKIGCMCMFKVELWNYSYSLSHRMWEFVDLWICE